MIPRTLTDVGYKWHEAQMIETQGVRDEEGRINNL
jgi:hypothetical protein